MWLLYYRVRGLYLIIHFKATKETAKFMVIIMMIKTCGQYTVRVHYNLPSKIGVTIE